MDANAGSRVGHQGGHGATVKPVARAIYARVSCKKIDKLRLQSISKK